jgi:hypothetical protein
VTLQRIQNSAFFGGLRFVHAHLRVVSVLSGVLIIPCIWHRRIEAGDLPSHIYNAWLAQLIGRGEAPGLYTVRQWNNVLFDFFLLYSTKLFGFLAGSAILVSACALVFFWGVFSFVTVTSGRPPWLLAPVIAMFTYGYTFNMGFFNYYLSIGLACFGLAVLWRPQGWDWIVGGMLLVPVVFAHPIGTLWFLGMLVYIFSRRRFGELRGFIVPVTTVGIFIAAHWYLAHLVNFEVYWENKPFYLFNGADQLVVYSGRYRWIACAFLATVVIWFTHDCLRWRESVSMKPLFFLAELYLVSFFGVSLLPEGLRGGMYSAGIGYLVPRLTLICAVFVLCAIGCLKPRKWALLALTASAAAFFVSLYQDTGVINRLELHVETLTGGLPYGTRVIPSLLGPTDSRISTKAVIGHVVDRACVGRCFSYSNYEPSSGLFRVRAHLGSPIVTSEAIDSQDMAKGTYVVRDNDLPLIIIYQCVPGNIATVCLRNLTAGETTGQR